MYKEIKISIILAISILMVAEASLCPCCLSLGCSCTVPTQAEQQFVAHKACCEVKQGAGFEPANGACNQCESGECTGDRPFEFDRYMTEPPAGKLPGSRLYDTRFATLSVAFDGSIFLLNALRESPYRFVPLEACHTQPDRTTVLLL